MNRTETTIVALAAFAIAVVHAPAFGQYVVFDGKDSSTTVKQVAPEGKDGKNAKVAVKNGKRLDKEGNPKPPPEPKTPTFTATGGFESTKEKARESAIRTAVELLHKHMQEQDPPVHRMPKSEMVQRMLLSDQEKVIEEPDIDKTSGETKPMYRVTVAVRVEPQHVRELRSLERSSEALWVLAGLGGVAGVLAMFFRIDAWTKGYLTSWLVLGTVGAGGLLAGLWWWAK
jgi:hypothetical protein